MAIGPSMAIEGRSRGAPRVSAWRAALSASCASLVGIGLARFAYTPLLPAIVEGGWFAPEAAAYLGAANLAGYLAGALLARPMASAIAAPVLLRGLMILAAIAFLACSLPISLAWFFAWRLLSGVAGGGLMVLAATTVLPHVPPGRRGLASGAIFAGVGVGIAVSGTLVPLLLRGGLAIAWTGLGALCIALTLVAWAGWPSGDAPTAAARHHTRPHAPARLVALYAGYGLNAVGLVPHMIFFVDFVARGLGRGLDAGAQCWVLFGLGAVAGPLAAGRLADAIGFGPALRISFMTQAVLVLLPVLNHGALCLAASSIAVGAFVPGIVTLALGRIHELLPRDADAQRSAWSKATTAFAVMQAAGAYGMTFVFGRSGGSYELLFTLGSIAMTMALAADLVVGAAVRRGKAT